MYLPIVTLICLSKALLAGMLNGKVTVMKWIVVKDCPAVDTVYPAPITVLELI